MAFRMGAAVMRTTKRYDWPSGSLTRIEWISPLGVGGVDVRRIFRKRETEAEANEVDFKALTSPESLEASVLQKLPKHYGMIRENSKTSWSVTFLHFTFFKSAPMWCVHCMHDAIMTAAARLDPTPTGPFHASQFLK